VYTQDKGVRETVLRQQGRGSPSYTCGLGSVSRVARRDAISANGLKKCRFLSQVHVHGPYSMWTLAKRTTLSEPGSPSKNWDDHT
jgi:hypothetical protein